jgi:TerC family integral membrane protein
MPDNETIFFVAFNVFVLGMLILDLLVFHRSPHEVKLREATIWSVVWISLALLFNGALFVLYGTKTGMEFLTGYVIEKALSVDNIFVFIMIFAYFGVPPKYQHRVLFLGIVGALIMRAIFIGAGVLLIAHFEWILYVFGIILIVSGWKMAFNKEVDVHPDRNMFIRFVRKLFPVTTGFESQKFVVRQNGKLHITPLLLVLITIETTDVVFAVDSIPAVFGVTHDPFIVYSSNVFAILGLRALYFVLSGVMNSFYYLKHGLSIVLIFIGVKMLIADLYHVPIGVSLGVIGTILTISVVLSMRRNRRIAAGQLSVDEHAPGS